MGTPDDPTLATPAGAGAHTYGVAGAALVGGLINAAINGGLGWVLVPAGATLPLWGVPGLGMDVLAMCFGIAFGTGLGVTPVLRAQARAGKVRAPEVSQFWVRGFANWPAGTLQRSINLGALSALVFGPPTLLLLWTALSMFGLEGLDRVGAAGFKAAFGLCHGALVTPIIGLGALHGPAPDRR